MEDFSNEETDQEAAELIRNSSNSSPQEAVKNIKRAEQHAVHPDEYEADKELFDPEAEIEERTPAQVDSSIKNYMSKSRNHTEVVKKEIGTLELISRQAKHMYYNMSSEKDVLDEEIQELNNIDRTKGLKDDQLEYLDGLYDIRDEKQASFGLEGFQTLPGDVVSVANDMFNSVTNNKSLILGSAAIGAVTPVPGGALAGAGYGVTAALAKDAYYRVADSTFGELRRMKGEDGKPLNLSREKRDNIAMSVGVVSSVLEAVSGKVITGGLSKLIKPKSAIGVIINNTSKQARMDLFGNAFKSAVSSGGEETAAEIVAIVGENFAKGSQNEEGLWNALEVTRQQILNDDKTFGRLVQTAVTGSVAGGAISGGLGGLGYKKIKKTYDDNNADIDLQKKQFKVIDEVAKTLNAQDDFIKMASASMDTELKNMSPDQMTELRKEMFKGAGFENKIWFSAEDVAKIEETNPEIAQKIRDFDVTESNKSDTSSPVGIEPHNFLDLVEELPETSDYFRLNPEAANPLESREILKKYDAAEKAREEIFKKAGVDGKLSDEQIEQLRTIETDIREITSENTRESYIESPTFTENIEEVLSKSKSGKAEVEKFNESQRAARTAVVEEFELAFQEKEQRIENRVVRANEKIEKELQLKENKKGLELVEKFKGDKTVKRPEHKKKGYSALAIDPSTVPEDIREAVVNDPKLVSRKVFVEGGMTLEESAVLAGAKDGAELIKLLANAPTKKEMLTARKAKAAEIREKVKETRAKTEEQRREKAFNDLNNLNLKEMEFMRINEWGSTKTGFKKIALPIPKIEELNRQAYDIVNKTRIGVLSPRQFLSGEKSLNRKAFNHIAKNEVEQAFLTKEKGMINVELMRESLKARAEIDSARKFVKRITSKSGINTLKKAGLHKQAKVILDVFNLNPSPESKAKQQDNYIDHLVKLEAQGKSVVVPEHLSDVRRRGEDLTVQQYLKVADTLRSLEKQAKLKNKLLNIRKKRDEFKKIQTVEQVVEKAIENLKNHPKYKEGSFRDEVKNENSIKVTKKINKGFGLLSSMLTNLKNVVTELDQEALQGEHYENIAQPLVDAETKKRTKIHNLLGQMKKIEQQYGAKKFKEAFNDFIDIKEFEGYNDLGNGVMARSDMWTLLAYLGDPEGKKRIENFKHAKTGEPLTVEIVQRVLDTHLTKKDAKLTQNYVNIFKSFEQEASDLHFRTTGVKPRMVKGVPITHRGKVLEGGYTPLNYARTSPQEKISRFLDVFADKESALFGNGNPDENKLYGRLRAAEQTEQGRLIDRGDTTRALDVNFMNFLHSFEEHIHDVSYREAGMDTLTLLRNPIYSEAIIDTVGEFKYNQMTNGIIETVGKAHSEDILNPFSREMQAVDSVYRYVEQGFNIKTLAFKWTSVAMQPLSFAAAALRMGPKGGRYLAKSLGTVIKNLHDYDRIYMEAVKINPDLLFNKDSVDDTLIKSTYSELPRTSRAPFAKQFAAIKRGNQHFVDAGMLGLKKLDIHIKVATTMAAYSQFLNGDVKNFDSNVLAKMTDAEIDAKAKKYVKQVADLALTTSTDIDKSAIEKIKMMRIFTRFYTDLRSQINTGASQVRKISNSGTKAMNAIQEGDRVETLSNLKEGAVDASALFTVYTLSRLYTDMLYDEDNPIDDLKNVNDFESLGKFMHSATSYTVKAPFRAATGSLPIVRDIDFAMGSNRARKKVNLPLNQILSDVTMGISGLNDWLEGEDMSFDQKKGLVASASYLTGGIPVNGPIQLYELVEDSKALGNVSEFIGRETIKLAVNIRKFIDKYKDDPEKQEIIEELREVQQNLLPASPESAKSLIPETTMDTLKMNKWSDEDPVTGAVGIYQFTEERWNEISEFAPELGLTEDGRVSSDPKEQEKAMKWNINNISENLLSFKLEVNETNIFGAHRFGVDDFITVMLSEDTELISDLVGNVELFKGFKTVKSVKDFLAKKVNENKQIDNENR